MSWFKKKDPVDYRLEITKLQLEVDILLARTANLKELEEIVTRNEAQSALILKEIREAIKKRERKKKKKS